MTQTAFIETLARRFDVTKISLYSASPDANLGARSEGESSGTWPYREAVGGLMWLVVVTRPDMGNAVRAVARQSHNPTARHWKAVIQIIQYLLGTKDLGPTFERGRDWILRCLWVRTICADKADDRRSVSGIAVNLAKSVVSWSRSKQGVTALSTAQAEYIATGGGVEEGLFVISVLSFIVPFLSDQCFKMFADKDRVIALATNPLSSARTKHIDVHFIRELVRSNTYVSTKKQRADIVTKTLVGADFKAHRGFSMNLHV